MKKLCNGFFHTLGIVMYILAFLAFVCVQFTPQSSVLPTLRKLSMLQVLHYILIPRPFWEGWTNSWGGYVAAAWNGLGSNTGMHGMIYHQPYSPTTLLPLVVVVIVIFVMEIMFMNCGMVIMGRCLWSWRLCKWKWWWPLVVWWQQWGERAHFLLPLVCLTYIINITWTLKVVGDPL